MRGGDDRTGELFSYVDLEARVRRNHPLRAIRLIVSEALSALERDFAALYSPIGRPSIPPEKLLRAMLLQAFYSIRSERLLMERLEYDLLFRWFVGIGVDDAAWDHSVFSKNRDRLLEGDIAAKFLAAVLAQPKAAKSGDCHSTQQDYDSAPSEPVLVQRLVYPAGNTRSVCSSNNGSSCPTRTNSSLRASPAGTSKYWMPSGISPQSPQGGLGTSLGSAGAFSSFA
ncbi:Transposase domain [Mesorhizobium qingshengii]|uniref:Transposase domain n=1 Tax=Mesorhizobium qingshengii TaxID=1165689 RepID=A0A1G5Y0H3_9HYPH|nr:Transposase domain [Mesorhizobium qingshengii]